MILLPDARVLVSSEAARSPALACVSWRTATAADATVGAAPPRCVALQDVHMTALATSPQGAWLAGGDGKGHLRIWNLASGALVRTFTAHFKRVTALTFTRDGAFLVSGAKDSFVHTWSMASLVETTTSVPTAHCSFSDHTLGITALLTGEASGRVVTASLDYTCKVIDATEGIVLSSFSFASPIHGITMDAAETILFAGAADGCIYGVPLVVDGTGQSMSRKKRQRTGPSVADENAVSVFRSRDVAVTDVAQSWDGGSLVSTHVDGTIGVWDVDSKQLVRMLTAPSPHSATVACGARVAVAMARDSPVMFGVPRRATFGVPAARQLVKRGANGKHVDCVEAGFVALERDSSSAGLGGSLCLCLGASSV